jgi:hypothetical protein
MSFLQPTYLWGFLALIVPIVIHLLNKGDMKVVKVGSLKYLHEEDSKQSTKIRLNELLLLFLRLLTISLLVLILAEPVVTSKTEVVPLTYIIEPSLLDKTEIKSLIENGDAVDVRLLSDGFPKIDDEIEIAEAPNYWQLAQQMQKIESDSIVVFTKALLRGLKGKRPSVTGSVNWVVMEDVDTKNSLVASYKVGDSLELINVHSNSTITDIEKKIIAKEDSTVMAIGTDSLKISTDGISRMVPLYVNDTLQIRLLSDDDFKLEKLYFQAAFKALKQYGNYPLRVSTDTNFVRDFDVLIWLKNESPPLIAKKQLMVNLDSLSNSLIQKGPKKNVYHLTERLNINNVVQERFAEQLAEILFQDPLLDSMVLTYDKRVLPEDIIKPNSQEEKTLDKKKESASFSHWLWIIVVGILILERIISKIRTQ